MNLGRTCYYSLSGGLFVTDDPQNGDIQKSERRAFLEQCGRFAIVTPPVVTLMLSVSDKAKAQLVTSARTTKPTTSTTTTPTTTTPTTTPTTTTTTTTPTTTTPTTTTTTTTPTTTTTTTTPTTTTITTKPTISSSTQMLMLLPSEGQTGSLAMMIDSMGLMKL